MSPAPPHARQGESDPGEALTMIAVQVMANDVAVGSAAPAATWKLNLQRSSSSTSPTPITLMSDGCYEFPQVPGRGNAANLKKIKEYVERSLMLVTALAPVIGYDQGLQDCSLRHGP